MMTEMITGIDPLTGEVVDKANAYIVTKSDRNVLYFAYRSTYEQYVKSRNSQ